MTENNKSAPVLAVELDMPHEVAYSSAQQHPPRLSTMRTRRVSFFWGRK